MKHVHEISGRSRDVRQKPYRDNAFNYNTIMHNAHSSQQNKRNDMTTKTKTPNKKILLGADQIEWYETSMKQV